MGIGGGKSDREKYCRRAVCPGSRWLAGGDGGWAEQSWGTPATTERAWARAEKAPVYAGAKNGSPAKKVSKRVPSDKKLSTKKVPSEKFSSKKIPSEKILSDGVDLWAEGTPAEGAEGTGSKGSRVAERTPAEGTGTGGIGSGGGRVHTQWATSGTDDVCRLPVGSLYTRA